MPERLLQLEDIRNAQNPEQIAVLFRKLGYNASAEPLSVEELELPSRSAEAVVDAYVIAHEEKDDLWVCLFRLQPKEFSSESVAESRMKAIAENLCKNRICHFLLFGTKDYKQLLLVKPQKDESTLKVSVNFWYIDLRNPTVYDRHRLENIAAFSKTNKRDLHQVQREKFVSLKQKKNKKSKSYTEDLIRLYLQEIGRFKLLNKGEELELGREIIRLQELEAAREKLTDELGRKPQDDEWANKVGMELEDFKLFLQVLRKAREKMIVSNLRLVVSIAKKYQNRGVEFLDLIQEGNEGLIKAVERFDPNKGYKFSTYASWWIHQAVNRAIKKYSRVIELPFHIWEAVSKIKKTTQKLCQENGRKPTQAEIANHLEMTVKKLQFILESTQQTLSLDAETGDEKNSTFIESISSNEETPQEQIEGKFLRQDIERVLRDTLSDREQYVIRMRYGLDNGKQKSLQKIGDKLNLSRERIRQIEKKALKKMRFPKFKLLFEDYIRPKKVGPNLKKYYLYNRQQLVPMKIVEGANEPLSPVVAKTEESNILDVSLPAVHLEEEKTLSEFNDEIITAELCQLENQKVATTLTNFDQTYNIGELKPMNHNSAELKEQLQALKDCFLKVQNNFLEAAESLGVSPGQQGDEMVDFSPLESLLSSIEKAEEERSRATEVRQEALTVLERVLAIFHRDNSDFQPLLECHKTARELQQQISESVGVEVDSEIQALAEGKHPYSELLGLISERESQDYQRLMQLQAAVNELFDPPLAIAALTGNLVFPEEAKKDEVNYPQESDSEEEDFVNKNPPEASEVASNNIPPPVIEDSQEQLVDEVVPEEGPLETVNQLPTIEDSHWEQPAVEVIPDEESLETEAPEETVTWETVTTISEEETEKEQPVWNFSTEGTAEAIAQSIKNYTKKGRPAALGHLIWRLILEEQFGFAYHLARALEQQEPKLEPHLPSWLIRAVGLGQHLRSNIDPIAYRLKDDLANYTETPGEDEWNYAVMLLLAAASLRPALLAPDTGAYSILQRLPLGKAQLSRLYDYCQVISEYGRQHLALEPKMLKKATSPAERQKSLDRLEQTVDNWWFQVQTLDMKHGVASRVWENWLKADGLVNSLLNPIRTKNTSALATIRQQVTGLSDESNLKEAARRTEGQFGIRRRGNPIPEKVVNRLCKFATQAVDLAREWVDLQQEELEVSQKSYIQQQAEQLGKEISAVQDGAIAELDDYEKQDHPLFVLAGISCCRKAIEDIRSLFDPDKPLPVGKRNLEYIIHAPLLKIPSLPMNEEWEPDVSDVEQIVDGIVETVASGDRNWEQAFEERCEQKDHEATERIIEYLRVNPSELINLEGVEQERDQELKECRTYLSDEISKTRIKVEEAVVSGLLIEAERADYVAQIEVIENAVETTLRFSEKLAWLEGIDEAIQTKRAEEIKEFKQKLDRLEMDREHPDYRRICQVVERGDLLTANEYIDRIGDGYSLPPEQTESGNNFKDFLERYPDLEPALERAEGNRPERRDLIKDVSRGKSIGQLQIADSPQAKQASELLGAWLTAKGRRQAIDEKCIKNILSHLSWNPARVTLKTKGRYTWIDAVTEILQDRDRCPLPAYGSEAEGGYRILCVWDKPTEEDLLNAVGETSLGSPVIVFYFGTITLEMRRNLARLCHLRRRTFIVIDDALVLYLCGDRGSRLSVLFDCGLAFTFLEPYTTTAGLVPPEMFYGRERERDSIINPMGSCFIYGGRQLGKTVLLRYVERTFHAPRQGRIALWLDLKTEGICDDKDIDEIWNILATEFKELGVVPASRSARVKEDKLLEQIQTWLEHDRNRRILLLLDEADRFLETDGKKSTDKTRGNFIRSARLKGLMDRTNRRFKVVFAGLHNVQRTTKLENHPLAHLGEPICIGPLLNNGEAREARALVERPLASLGYCFESPDLVTRILSQTNYYPSLIQLYCQQLLKHVNNPDFVTFDPKTSPPYIITAKEVDDAYKDRDLRKAIRDRFIWTLQLDERYQVIAYAIAHGCLEDEGDKVDGFPVSWIQDEVLTFWDKGFQGLSSDRIRVLLEEMVGLGVLRQAREGYFTLRNANVLRLMGTKQEIVDELLREDREVPPEYESETEGVEQSPLTVKGEPELANNPNRVSILCLSESSRYHLRHNLKFKKLELGDKLSHYLDDLSTKDDLPDRLKKLTRYRQKGTTEIYICDSCSWSNDWIDEAIEEINKLRSIERPVQVFFIADPKKTWQLISFNPLDWSRELMVNFEPGFDLIWEPLVKKHNFPTDRATREKICAVTGNWLVLLMELFEISKSENLGWQEALEELNQRLNSSEFARKQAYFIGFNHSRPQQERILKALAILGEVSAEDLIELVEGITPGILNRTLRWAELLNFVTPVGEKDDGKNYWRIDPVVGRILQVIDN